MKDIPHGVLERLVPDVVACAETWDDLLDIELFPTERRSLGQAVDKRRREFITGRACARLALGRLGAPLVAIPNGRHGEPLWPRAIVGSITHCEGYRACAAAWSDSVTSIGIDAEPNLPLPDGVLSEVVHGRERELVAAGPLPPERHGHPSAERVDPGRLLFSAKEAVYKAWFPLTRRWLDFTDAEVSIDPPRAEFQARLLVPGPVVNGSTLTEFRGRWAVENEVICTAVVVPSAIRAEPVAPSRRR